MISRSVLLMLLTALFFLVASSSAFTVGGPSTKTRSVAQRTTSTQLFFFGEPKDDGKPGDYVCKVRTSNVLYLLFQRLRCFVSSVTVLASHCYPQRNKNLLIVSPPLFNFSHILQQQQQTGLRLRLYQGTQSVGRTSRQLQLPSLRRPETTLQKGPKGQRQRQGGREKELVLEKKPHQQ